MTEAWEIHICNEHICAHAGSIASASFAHGATTEHEELGRLHARHATNELALAAFCFLEIVSSVDGCHGKRRSGVSTVS